jgi:hypothetical protein
MMNGLKFQRNKRVLTLSMLYIETGSEDFAFFYHSPGVGIHTPLSRKIQPCREKGESMSRVLNQLFWKGPSENMIHPFPLGVNLVLFSSAEMEYSWFSCFYVTPAILGCHYVCIKSLLNILTSFGVRMYQIPSTLDSYRW